MTLRANQLAGLGAAIAEVRPLAAPADTLLHHFFRRHPAMGQHDRAFIADARLRVSASPALAGSARADRRTRRSSRSRCSCASSATACATSHRSSPPPTRRGSPSSSHDLAPTLAPAVAADLPDWLWERLGAAYGEDERIELARAWLAPAPLDLRVNPLKTTRDDARAALAASGIDATDTPYSPLGLAHRGPTLARAACAGHGRHARSPGRRQPARRLPGRAAPRRDGRRFLRRRRRQDAAPGRADALAGAALRVRRRRDSGSRT